MPGELSSRLLQAGSPSYYHDLDNNAGGGGGGVGGGSSMPLQALSDVSNSQLSQGSFGYEHECQNSQLSLDEVDNLEKTADINIVDHSINNNKTNNFLIAHGSSTRVDNGFRADSLINFKNGSDWTGGFKNGKASLLSFEQKHQIRINRHKDIDDSFLMSCHNDYNSRQVTISNPMGRSSYHFLDEISTGNHQPGSSSYGLLYSDSTVIAADRIKETLTQGGSLLKRPHTGSPSSQPPKKQCTSVVKGSSSKPNKPATSKDPQSIAAKNRRERISERLKILQELVPNGPKVELVTMLEKAISYVKFLQLQVKVLATDEFWPAQGGKAPDISQVKEAIDAILASQRERSSSSK